VSPVSQLALNKVALVVKKSHCRLVNPEINGSIQMKASGTKIKKKCIAMV